MKKLLLILLTIFCVSCIPVQAQQIKQDSVLYELFIENIKNKMVERNDSPSNKVFQETINDLNLRIIELKNVDLNNLKKLESLIQANEKYVDSKYTPLQSLVYSTHLSKSANPGNSLIQARNYIFGGLSCQIAGIVIMGTAEEIEQLYVGLGASVIGTILELIGIHKIGKAGVEINEFASGLKLIF